MILRKDDHKELYDKPYSLQCPHCNNITGITLISIPNYSYLERFKPERIGMVYKCDACSEPIFLKFRIQRYETGNYRINIDEEFQIIEHPKIDFEFEHLPEKIRNDFKEALDCASIGAYNAFASMCRRTIQSSASEIGAKGKDKIQNQIQEMKEIADIDDETFEIIKQIILDGHDGAHPHLPSLSESRAEVLLELIKDVMYQLFVRKSKLKKAAELRKQQIEKNK